ncbi:MAG: hypothetical protein HN730_11160 [Bdellovibrionales bacterium]|nr:hypothetical protein [Bdellovibrionales bacterium]
MKNTNLECAQAMMAQVGNSAVTTVLQVINPFSPAGIFTYKGSFGLMILSKKPLANSQLIDMSTISTLTRRGALVVTVKERDKNIDLLCTHLTADLDSTAPYAGQLSGWREENEKQVVYLLGRMKDRNDSQILMGDFNCSFADPKNSINGEFESHCQRFIDMGYQDPISKNIRKCTFCSSNSVVDRGHDNTVLDVLLDHLFVRKLTVKSSRRSYENLVEILVEGKPEQSNLSDHYGVDATVE